MVGTRRTTTTRLPALAVALALALGACAGPDDPAPAASATSTDQADGTAPDAGPEALADLALATASATAFDRVDLTGIEDGAATRTVVWLDGVDALPRPVLLDEDGPFVIAPVHPTDADGGPVELRFEHPDGVGPTLTLDVAPPDGGDGSFDATLDALDAAIEERASSAGLSRDELAATGLAELDPILRHLRVASIWSAAARELRAELTDDELAALDRFTGAGGFAEVIAAEGAPIPAELLPAGGDTAALGFVGKQSTDGCIDNPLEFGTPQELSDGFLRASAAGTLSARQGSRGRFIEGTESVLSVGGVSPGLPGKTASAMGTVLAAFDGMLNGISGFNPTRLDALTAKVDTTSFEEDATDPGSFFDIRLTASATGWTIDDDLINVLTNLAGTLAPGAEQAEVVENATREELRQFAIETSAEFTNRFVNEGLQELPESVLRVCPKSWEVVVRSPGFTQGRAEARRLTVDNEAFTYLPREVGADTLVVEVFPALFAGRYAAARAGVEVKAIQVRLSPVRIEVEDPGQDVTVGITVENAVDTAVVWDPGNGSWSDGLGADTNDVPQRTLRTPNNVGDYPFTISAESTSRGGIRASGTPRRFGNAQVVLVPFRLVALPDEVRPDEESLLQATDLEGEPIDVSWEVSGGSLTETGRGTATWSASESGRYEVTATNEVGAERTVVIFVRDGECSFAYTIGGTRFVGRPGDTVSWMDGTTRESRVRMGEPSGEFEAQLTFTTGAGLLDQATGDPEPVRAPGAYQIRFASFELTGTSLGAVVAPARSSGDVTVSEYEPGRVVAASGAGEVLDPDGGFQVPPVPFNFEFTLTDDGETTFGAADMDCIIPDNG